MSTTTRVSNRIAGINGVSVGRLLPAGDQPLESPWGAVPARQRRRPREELTAFFTAAAAYLAVAWWMLANGVIFPDSVSRVANAYYVLFSRDPHLPAVGFVWNPLPSLLLLPVLPLKGIFPVLTSDGFAGPVESSLFMAGAVVLMLRLLRVLGVGRRVGWTLTALFAADPMIVVYGGSGESEAMLLFFALLACGQLARWLADAQPVHLVGVGVALGAAYLTRYEAVAPAAAVVVLVAIVTVVRTAGRPNLKLLMGLNDALLAVLPFVFTFAVWSLSSRILVKQWLPTFSSNVGNSSQVANASGYITRGTGSSAFQQARYVGDQLFGLEPLLVVLIVVAAVVAIRRRMLVALAAPTVLGAVLAFDNLAFLAGSSFGWLRFQITVVPLAFALAGTVIAGLSPAAGPVVGGLTNGRPRRVMTRTTRAVAATVALVAVSLPVTMVTLADHRLAREETNTILAAVAPGRATADDQLHLHVFETEHAVASSIDRMHLPPGSVVTDSTYSYDILLATKDPRQFVITSDRDFGAVLAYPRSHGARYVLVPDPAKAPFDAINKRYPGMYANGDKIAVLIQAWKSTSYNASWRLYRIDSTDGL